MRIFRNLAIVLAVFLVAFCASAQQSCQLELKNSVSGIHLVGESCKNKGTFSIGGIFNGNWEKLTFFYPGAWYGTFTSVKVDDKIYANSILPGVILLDDFMVEKPYASENQILFKWALPDKVSLEEKFTLSGNGTLITLTAKNYGDVEKKLSFRIHFDTMLGDNDGAPIYVPGDGLITAEKEYNNVYFPYWKAYNRKEKPTIISQGILSGEKLTTPEKIIVANWRKSTRSGWDYSADPAVSILGDSAVILYFAEQTVKPGEEKSVTTFYGRGEEILPGQTFGIAEITTENLGYCPKEMAGILVDVLSREGDKSGIIIVKVTNSSGGEIFSETRETDNVIENSIKTLKFIFTTPESGYPLNAEVRLFQETEIDKKTKDGIIKAKANCPQAIPEGTMLMFLLIIAILAIIIILYYYTRRPGKVIFKKIKSGDIVKITVWNNTSSAMKNVTMTDTIPENSEVKISTFGVRRFQNSLTWKIGTLRAKEKATLEYKIVSEYTEPLQRAKLVFDNQEIESEIVV